MKKQYFSLLILFIVLLSLAAIINVLNREQILEAISTRKALPTTRLPDSQRLDSKDMAIKQYLNVNVGESNYGGEIFSAYETIGSEKKKGKEYEYIWVFIAEYYLRDGVLTRGSTIGAPYALVLTHDKGTYWVESHQTPRSGTAFMPDVIRIFPSDVQQNKMFSADTEYYLEHGKMLEERVKAEAQRYFNSPTNSQKEK